MRKIVALFLCTGLLGAMVMTAGCFGDDGIGSILAAAILITIVASTAGSGGAGAAAFAASTRERPAVIMPAARTLGVTANGLRFRVTPYSNGVAAGDPVITTEITTNNTIQATGSVSISNSTTDFLVELLASDTTVMKAMISASGDVTKTVNPDTTAQALIYAEWLKRNPADKSVENFVQNLAVNSSSDDALCTTIYNLVNYDTTVASLADINLASTTYTGAATTAAAAISTDTRIVPTSLANYNGLWLCQGGALPVELVQNGNSITGEVNGITPLTGSVSGLDATLNMTPSGRTEVWNLTMNDANTSFSGTYTATYDNGQISTGTISGVLHP